MLKAENGTQMLLNETKPCCVGPPKMDGSWWTGLTECDPLEKGMATHSSILAWRIPWTKSLADYSPRDHRVGHD